MAVDFLKSADDVLNRLDISLHDVVAQALLLGIGQQQPAQVVPRALPDSRGRFGVISLLFINALEHGTHVNAQGDVVVLDSLV